LLLVMTCLQWLPATRDGLCDARHPGWGVVARGVDNRRFIRSLLAGNEWNDFQALL